MQEEGNVERMETRAPTRNTGSKASNLSPPLDEEEGTDAGEDEVMVALYIHQSELAGFHEFSSLTQAEEEGGDQAPDGKRPKVLVCSKPLNVDTRKYSGTSE